MAPIEAEKIRPGTAQKSERVEQETRAREGRRMRKTEETTRGSGTEKKEREGERTVTQKHLVKREHGAALDHSQIILNSDQRAHTPMQAGTLQG